MQKKNMIRYKLTLKNTASTIGYFQPEPEGIDSIEKGLPLLIENRYDDFLRNYLLSLFSKLEDSKKPEFIKKYSDSPHPSIAALAAEAAHISRISSNNIQFDLEKIKKETSLIYLKSLEFKDRKAHGKFAHQIFSNINYHTIPDSQHPEIEPDQDKAFFSVDISEIPPPEKEPCELTEDIFNHALHRFEKAGLIPGSEMRHFTSLSPEGILRKWYMKTTIKTGESDFSFEGVQTSYGKGETLESARISCLMEMCERISSFVSVSGNQITNRKYHPEIFRETYSSVKEKGLSALDPNTMRLEVPYRNSKLHWMKAKKAVSPLEYEDIYIPVQTSYLFCNLPEESLFSSLDSTGLAAGDTMYRARVKGIIEVIERDCEYSVPFHPDSCFRLKADSPEINRLFEFYRSRGIDFFFQDITCELGVPVYKAFVYGPDNNIYKGCSGHLNGKKAIIDALFEVPYPTMNNPASRKIEYDLAEILFEDIPDYSTGEMKSDLMLLEELLIKNGLNPVFSDITRPDLDIPVCRTIIPGLEINGDFDEYYRISRRQYNRFTGIFP